MRAVVVYESMFGHTREIAEQVATGLRTAVPDVTVIHVGRVGTEQLASADLLVVGGPTHVHGLPGERSRLAAVSDPAKYGRGAQLEPGADGLGLREWFETMPSSHGRAAAFDTRASGPPLLTGRASQGIAKRLARRGFDLVADPESFVLGPDAGLADGEPARAEAWGRSLAVAVTRDRVEDVPFSEA
jgi:hypothetical protein